MTITAFHLQSKVFDEVRPPAFGSHPGIDHVVRQRERENEKMSWEKLKNLLKKESNDGYEKLRTGGGFTDYLQGELDKGDVRKGDSDTSTGSNQISTDEQSQSFAAGMYSSTRSTESDRKIRKRPQLTKFKTVSDLSGGMKNTGGSLFLQEASHLISLLSAVALATLRHDIEKADTPLANHEPGSPWPPVDPDSDFYESDGYLVSLRYLLGQVRSPKQRTVYNFKRPFTVLGGVSDAEIEQLQRARGPHAKTALCSMWLQEFLAREFKNGSLEMPPPIVGRLFVDITSGMMAYNQARKVAYVPFPFAHSQLTTFFLVLVTALMPILMLTFVTEVIMAVAMNAMAVAVFYGMIYSFIVSIIKFHLENSVLMQFV